MSKILQDRIKKLTAKNKNLRRANLALKSELAKKLAESDITPQEFFDMRLRAQKAELALEAMTSATTNNQIAFNTRKYKFEEAIKKALTDF